MPERGAKALQRPQGALEAEDVLQGQAVQQPQRLERMRLFAKEDGVSVPGLVLPSTTDGESDDEGDEEDEEEEEMEEDDDDGEEEMNEDEDEDRIRSDFCL